MIATTMLLLPVVVTHALVAPIFVRYHCWLNIGSLGMSPGGGGGGGARTSVRFTAVSNEVLPSAVVGPADKSSGEAGSSPRAGSLVLVTGGSIGSILPFGSTAEIVPSPLYASMPSRTLMPSGSFTSCQPSALKLRLTVLPICALPTA